MRVTKLVMNLLSTIITIYGAVFVFMGGAFIYAFSGSSGAVADEDMMSLWVFGGLLCMLICMVAFVLSIVGFVLSMKKPTLYAVFEFVMTPMLIIAAGVIFCAIKSLVDITEGGEIVYVFLGVSALFAFLSFVLTIPVFIMSKRKKIAS